jgi:hypothetical protein
MRKIMAAAMASMALAGVTLISANAQASVREPSCGAQLAAIRLVGHQAGVGIGSSHLRAITDTGPRTWAAELRHVGITDGSEWAALHIHSLATARRFIAWLEQDAAGALMGQHCTR